MLNRNNKCKWWSKKRQGTTSQLAEKVIWICEKRQGTASQLSEKFIWICKKRQGTTSVVPIEQQNHVGL